MPDISVCTQHLRRLAAALVIALGLAVAAQPARAQSVVVFVNGEPITALDVDQRIKLIEVSTHKAPSRQEALDELIDEKLKIQIGKRYGLDIPDKDIESSFSAMARRAGQTSKQFSEGLGHAGINVPALKRRIKADITWSSLIRGKFPSVNAVGERDVLTAMESKKTDEKDAVSFQYTLRELLFIVPHGSPPAAFEARRKQAEELRHRFESCEQGVPFARALTDVAVREPVRRTSLDMGAPQRAALDATAVGHLTAPEQTQQGIEMIAVCAREKAAGDTIGMAQTREAMVAERYNAQAKRYLEQLRREAIIETPH
ncbi:MAG: SurA N-terminal domain-containing protein [Bradyrhizobiaceae bacterium]|nr:SurA N-terminal domain-containing protein [Hyphomicrobiales bacterium]MBV9428289.1 SurA N-terminal domain-containing protein [Bradyrhizobiaceae bacterium]